MRELSVTSGAFIHGGTIPSDHTCTGKNISPGLQWTAPPQGTQCMVVICDDPDAPSGVFTHWILYNIPAGTGGLGKGIPAHPRLTDGSIHGINSYGKVSYSGPCPPPGHPHRYFFRVYALDITLAFPKPPGQKAIEEAIRGHVLANGELMGMFGR